MTCLSSHWLNAPITLLSLLSQCGHVLPLSVCRMSWGGHVHVLQHTFVLWSPYVDFSGQGLPVSGLHFTPAMVTVFVQPECSSSWARPLAPARIPWRQLSFAVLSGMTSQLHCGKEGLLWCGLFLGSPWIVPFNIPTLGGCGRQCCWSMSCPGPCSLFFVVATWTSLT